jgi:probable rRNA maturation factor
MPHVVQVRAAGSPAAADVPDAAARRLLGRAVRAALRDRGVRDAEVSLALLDDTGITELNARFLSHDEVTDVISFALYEDGEAPVGDIYIGYQQAARQAAAAGVPVTEELTRLAVHGTLHVLGFDHPEGQERLDSEMWQLQERIVAAVLRQ